MVRIVKKRTPDVFDGHSCDDGKGRRFTNTVVPRFYGMGCWQQHLLIFHCEVKWMVTDDGSSPIACTP